MRLEGLIMHSINSPICVFKGIFFEFSLTFFCCEIYFTCLFFREPTLRPSCSQLLNHAFFKQINKTDSLAQILHEAQPIEEDAGNFAFTEN